MAQMRMQSLYVILVIVSILQLSTYGQTPCQITKCPLNTYCTERASGSTACIHCDSACVSCFGPGPDMCSGCKIGFAVKIEGDTRPCRSCDDGWYGDNCTHECHCLNNQLCNKTNGFCLGWKCDRGYTGLPFCQESCPDGTFGLDCNSQCHCPDNDNCSTINGDCQSGLCHADWGSAGCQTRLPRLIKPPELLEATCGNITIQWEAFNETKDLGTAPTGQYNIYIFLNDTNTGSVQSWHNVGNVSAQPGKSKYTMSATVGLLPDEEYTFRVDVVGVVYDKLMSQVSTGTKSDIILNPCLTTSSPIIDNTTKIAISRKVFDFVNVTAQNSTQVSVSWAVLAVFAGYEYNVTVTRQLLGNGDCDSDGGPLQVTETLQMNSSPYIFSDLLTWSTYRITISAIAVSAQLRETYSQIVTTLSSLPNGTVANISYDSITSTEGLLSWKPVPCSQRKGPLKSYDLRVIPVGDSSTSELTYVTGESRFRLGNLSVYTNYSVQIRFTTVTGAGPWSQPFVFTTGEDVPGPVDILGLTPTYSTITVKFEPPKVANGIITTYTTMFTSSNSDFSMAESLTVVATAGRFTMTLDRLSPETVYYLKMAASTSVGIGPYGPVNQTKTLQADASPEPMSMKLLSQTNSCLTIEWTTPASTLAAVSGFVLEVRRVSADITIPSMAVNILMSQNSYQMCQLQPSTLYRVTISATNINGVVTSATDSYSTKHGTPPAPVAPVFVRSAYTNITIEIEPVVSFYVPITAYEIQTYLIPTNSRRKRFSGVPGYVTGELSPADVISRRQFIVGDGKTYGRYTNKPLEANSNYMVYYIAVSTLNGENTTSWSQLKTAVKTVPFDPSLAPPLVLSVLNKNMTCLNIQWEFPQGAENETTGFIFTLKMASSETFLVTRQLSAATLSHQECHLNAYTSYTIGITMQTTSGVLTTVTETLTTEHNTPSKPPVPVFVSATFRTITVSLQPAVLTDAPVTAYHIQVQTASSSFSSSSSRRRRLAEVPGYVTAQLTQFDILEKINFIVGDGKDYGGFINKPLEANTAFIIHYVVISTAGGVTKYSYSSLQPAATTSPLTSSQDDKGVYIGVIVALIIFILLIFLLLFLYWYWKRHRFNPYEIQEDDKKLALPKVKDEYEPENFWTAAYNLKDSRHIIAGRHLVYKEDNFPYANKKTESPSSSPKVSFSDEFHNLPHKLKRSSDGIAQQNKNLNRFPHLLPYDHSLVKLKADTSSRKTYINASWIPGYKNRLTYIAAQSPYDDTTKLDFWRLIYQQSIKTVVMLSNVLEDGLLKCARYWPESHKESLGNFILYVVQVREYADVIIRTVGIKRTNEEHSKIVQIFQFTAWPDHGVPDDPIPFVDMRYKVRHYHHDGPGPILVHCGTGMGRSGVFIAVDALIEQYAMEGRVKVFDFVSRMRKARPYMVRTEKQYMFIYEAIFEEYHAGDTVINFDLQKRYHNWSQRNPETGHTYLRDQQQLLEAFSRGPAKDEFKTALLKVNVQKNRYEDILPPEKYRPVLKSQGGLNSTDYINAVFLDSHFRKNHFIVTQTPLHTTIIDFWKLVYDYNVHTIIMVEDFKNEDNTCAEYWPSMNLKLFEPFFIEMTATYQHENISIRNFSIRSTQFPKEPARLVRQFQLTSWAQFNVTPPSRTELLDLILGMSAWQDEICQDENPIIVHCQNGATHSGLFTGLAVLCQKMEEEGEVDIYRTIKHCKRRRTKFFSEYEQLQFCYKAVWDFINLHMPGGTFTDTFQRSNDNQLFGVRSLSIGSLDKDDDDDQEVYI